MASHPDQIAYAEGYRYVVGNGAVYTTTRQEALREAERMGLDACELEFVSPTQRKAYPFLAHDKGARKNPGSTRKNPDSGHRVDYLNTNDPVWTRYIGWRKPFHLQWESDGTLHFVSYELLRFTNQYGNTFFGPGNWSADKDSNGFRVFRPTLEQVEAYLKRLTSTGRYVLTEVAGKEQFQPALSPTEAMVFHHAWAELAEADAAIQAKFEYGSLIITMPADTPEALIKRIGKVFSPKQRKVYAYTNSEGKREINYYPDNLANVKDWMWQQLVTAAEREYKVKVHVIGTVPFAKDETEKKVQTFEQKLSANAGQWAGRHVQMTFDGRFYIVSGAPDTEFTTTLLGRGADGLGLGHHKAKCVGTEQVEDEEATAEARAKAKAAGMKKRDTRNIVIYKTIVCKAHTHKIPLGSWYTADVACAAKLKALADTKASAGLEAAQRLLDARFQEALERKKSSPTLIQWSAAKKPLPGMGDPSVPCPPSYIDVDGKAQPLAFLPYQLAGILYASKQKTTLLADEMGVGKTAQALGVINNDPSIRKVLILAPSLSLFNWEKEAKRWLVRCNPSAKCKPSERLTIEVMEDSTIPKASSNIVVCNYEKMAGDRGEKLRQWAMSQPWDLLIADECHYCKLRADSTRNTISRRALALYGWPAEDLDPAEEGLVHRAKKVILMTGTPIPNRPIEIWPLANFLAPGEFGDRFAFGKRFCDLHKEASGSMRVPDSHTGESVKWMWGGAGQSDTNGQFERDTMGELQTLLRSYGMVRRTKKDVLNLPPKDREIVALEPTPEIERALQAEAEAMSEEGEIGEFNNADRVAELRKAWEELQEKIKKITDEMSTYEEGSEDWNQLERARSELSGSMPIPFKAISKTRHRMGSAKCESALSFMDDLIDTKGLKKLIVFAYHNDVVDRIVKHFRHKFKNLGDEAVAVINGKVSARKKQAATELFQNNRECRVFVGQLTSANTAITLTAANHIVFVEQDWVPGTMQQAEDRAHRLGQKGDAVCIKYLVVAGSIDGNMASILLNKRDMQQRALDRPPGEEDLANAFVSVEQGPILLDTGEEDGVLTGLLDPNAVRQPEILIEPPSTDVQTQIQAVLPQAAPASTEALDANKKPLPKSVPVATQSEIAELLGKSGIPANAARANSVHLVKCINERKYHEILLRSNKKSREVFETWTGIKLPSTDGKTRELMDAWRKMLRKSVATIKPPVVARPPVVPTPKPPRAPEPKPPVVLTPRPPRVPEPKPSAEIVPLLGAPTLAQCCAALQKSGLTPESAKKVGVYLHQVFTERAYNASLAPNNPRCRQTFEKLAGITLPSSLEGTQKAVAKWAKQRAQAAGQQRVPQVEAEPAPVRPAPVSQAPTPTRVPVAPIQAIATPAQSGGSDRAQQVHAALQAVVQSGAPVTPIARALAKLPNLRTDAQVQVALQAIRPFMAKLPENLRINPARSRSKGLHRKRA